ncbi:hypothetical protein OIU79_015811 [Salix purpurea]|uniref:Uncharacterized protein n=1 Tax=Salix purpurea TaxID=77065 RepID=A0A9Q0PCW2_SALPP|nr:hypothetical protein OIU79_015811 [Salix purpurea]
MSSIRAFMSLQDDPPSSIVFFADAASLLACFLISIAISVSPITNFTAFSILSLFINGDSSFAQIFQVSLPTGTPNLST